MRNDSRLGFALLLLGAALSTSCQRSSPAGGEPPSVTLPEGVAARVGSEEIRVETLSGVVAATRLEPQAALTALIADTLFASRARQLLPGAVNGLRRNLLARRLLEEFEARAEADGPATDAEVEAIRDERWWEFQRPELFRTIHAVVVVEKPERDVAARALAERVRAAAVGAPSAAAFRERVQAVAGEGLKLKVEELPPLAADGRATDPERPSAEASQQRFDSDFSAAATSLGVPGELSPVVHSKFGYHVIYLIERLPAFSRSLEDIRQLVAQEVKNRRAWTWYQAELTRLKAEVTIAIDPGALVHTELVRVAP